MGILERWLGKVKSRAAQPGAHTGEGKNASPQSARTLWQHTCTHTVATHMHTNGILLIGFLFCCFETGSLYVALVV